MAGALGSLRTGLTRERKEGGSRKNNAADQSVLAVAVVT
jgi:hypothetical protein